MTALYGFGTNPLYYYNQSGVVQTPLGDPNQFVQLSYNPFTVHSSCVGAAFNPVPATDTWIAASNTGEIAYTTNTAGAWTRYRITNGATTPLLNIQRIICHQGVYILVGAEKDPDTLQEYAVVYTTALGNAANTWYNAYKSTDNHSMILDVTPVANTTVLVAVGYKQGMQNPLILISSTGGLAWQEQSVDTNLIQGAIYSVAIAGNTINVAPTDTIKLYLGGRGWMAVLDFGTNQYYLLGEQFSSHHQRKPITRIVALNTYVSPSPGVIQIITSNIVALQGPRIYITSNLFDWSFREHLGYSFISAIYSDLDLQGTWYFGSASTLNQYNLWTLSTLPISVDNTTYKQIDLEQPTKSYNCGLQIQEFVLGS